MEVEGEHDAHSHNELDSVRTVGEDGERPAHFWNEGDSVSTVEEEDECAAHLQNEVHSVRNWKMKAEERRLKIRNIFNIMQVKMKEDKGEDADDGHYQGEVGLVIKTQEEGEQPAHFQIERGLVREME
jgi:hypothetical protein